jgi:glycosyltransferase involved in cell wall biosynthesis
MSEPSRVPRISVIIPARDAAPTLDRTLRSLEAQKLDEPFELIVVVDDDSRDETVEIARRHDPPVRVVHRAPGEGPGIARNRGVDAARAEMLAFIDADCFADSKWLSQGLDALRDADLVQGRVEPDPTEPRTPFDRTLVIDDHGGFYQTANLFVRRETFDSVGGFRDWVEIPRRRLSQESPNGGEALAPLGEDTLFAWSARRLGARSAFAQEAVVQHVVVPGRTLDTMADHWHWARYMPALARLVPELRQGAFHRRLFFNITTARFDLAVGGVLAWALTRRRGWLLAAWPYLRYVLGESRRYPARTRPAYLLGAPVVEAATVAGLVSGSVKSRCLVL